jgi:prepilin-type N-terminal cleavage/methylation domain-containing protein
MRRQRGFTLMEIMIAMSLTLIVTAAVLAIVRIQMRMFEMNDQVVRTQENARAAMDFLESMVRRACGAISSGAVGVNVPGVTQATVPCLRWYDGATVAATSFGTGSASLPDALEVVYGSGTMTALTAVPSLATSTPAAQVADVSGFAVGDYVLVGDFANADLFKVSAISTAVSSGTRPAPGTLSLGSLAGNVVGPSLSLAVGAPVLKAMTYSFFVAPAGTATYAGMLMVDADGLASTNHLDFTKVMPAAEGVVDFQAAIGNDGDGDGVITENASAPSSDEWIGNAAGETLPAPPWNASNLATPPQLRQVRLSFLFQTSNSYGGVAAALLAFEDRPASSYPSVSAATGGPRYRSVRMTVSPRAWNLGE